MRRPANTPVEGAPETWEPARRLAARIRGPLDRFLHVEAASGVVLLSAALIGLGWANSPWASTYDSILHARISIAVGSFSFEETLHFLVNDGLMTIFFLVVGLEIRREIHAGELSDLRKASLPIAAALGGMVVPALVFLALNAGTSTQRGFGIPMATDIAFAVGVLALLGKRVPPALRVLLLALAIIDDIGAIVVIAVFYSSGVAIGGLVLAAAGVLGVLGLQRLGARNALVYALPGAALWMGLLLAGIHPTIAGVILGMLTPVRAWFGKEGFVTATREAIDEFDAHLRRDVHEVRDLLGPMHDIKRANREALAPVVRIQAELHPWVAFGIMPVFALANSGVRLEGFDVADEATMRVFWGVLVGLVIGKPVGILAASALAIKVGLSRLPAGVTYQGLAAVGMVAGIGFTMAIFIADLAFDEAQLLSSAKLAVLLASGIAAVAGLLAGKLMLPAAPLAGAATSVEAAEAAAEL